MTQEEDELRRALEARSGAPTPEFRSRLSRALGTRPASTDFMPAIAVATVLALTVTTVGVLVAARHFGRSAGPAASGARTEAPSSGSNFQLSAPSANVVWALYDPDKLYRSTDQGSTWEIRSMPNDFGAHPRISFINDHEGWWLSPGPPMSECQQANATIFHTTDGGATWKQLPAQGIAQNQCKDGIWFFDSEHGFVSAADANHRPTVYRTSDGGKTWAATTLQDPAYFKSQPGGFTLHVDWMRQFGSSLYLEAYGGQDDPNLPRDNQFILRSTDGGATWTYVTKVPSRAIVMVTETRWLDFTTPGQAMESTNGGQQFHPFTSNFVADPGSSAQIVFADSHVGYASGAGHLDRTVDGGGKWMRLPPPGLGHVLPTSAPSPSPSPQATPGPSDVRLSAPSPDVVWALVGGQELFRSIDQGQTWQLENLPAGSFFTDVSFVDESDGWLLAAGPGGTQCSAGGATVWQTTDAGADWNVVTQVSMPPASAARSGPGAIDASQCKENLSFVDKQRGFLDAWDDNGQPSIYRTSDGGLTWAASRLSDPPGFHTLGAGDALRASPVRSFGAVLLVAAAGMQPDGVHRYVFESTDGGATWSSIAQLTSDDVAFVTAVRWIAVTEHLESTDSGKTWHAYASDYSQVAGVAPQVVFSGSSVGYAVERDGIHLTTDGGSHWSLIKTSWP